MDLSPINNKSMERGLLAFSIIVSFVLVELFCRVMLPRPGFASHDGNWLPGAIEPHPTRLYGLVPNFSRLLTGGMYKKMWVETNEEGMRDRPLERVRSSQLRIIAIGDSFTFGTGVEATQTWPSQLERALLVQSPAPSIAVVNAGVPGYGLAQMRDLTEELVRKLDPHLVIVAVYAGGFDRMLDPFTALGAFVVRSSNVKQIRVVDGGVIVSHQSPSLASFDIWLKTHWYSAAYAYGKAYIVMKDIRNALNSLRRADTAAAAKAMETEALHRGLEEIKRIKTITGERGVPLLVLLVGSFDIDNRPNMDQLATNNIVREFCSAQMIPAVDPTARLLRSGEPLRVNEEDFHWSVPANALVAQEVASSALQLMKQTDSRASLRR
jgi:hypothetical protein